MSILRNLEEVVLSLPLKDILTLRQVRKEMRDKIDSDEFKRYFHQRLHGTSPPKTIHVIRDGKIKEIPWVVEFSLFPEKSLFERGGKTYLVPEDLLMESYLQKNGDVAEFLEEQFNIQDTSGKKKEYIVHYPAKGDKPLTLKQIKYIEKIKGPKDDLDYAERLGEYGDIQRFDDFLQTVDDRMRYRYIYKFVNRLISQGRDNLLEAYNKYYPDSRDGAYGLLVRKYHPDQEKVHTINWKHMDLMKSRSLEELYSKLEKMWNDGREEEVDNFIRGEYVPELLPWIIKHKPKGIAYRYYKKPRGYNILKYYGKSVGNVWPHEIADAIAEGHSWEEIKSLIDISIDDLVMVILTLLRDLEYEKAFQILKAERESVGEILDRLKYPFPSQWALIKDVL